MAGATRVHMYRAKHIQDEMIFTHTADMLADMVSEKNAKIFRLLLYTTVLWIRNYFFRIRIPFSAEFWIRIRKK
jgi:hypothetical protein